MKRIRKYKSTQNYAAINGLDLRLKLAETENEIGEIFISYISSYPKISDKLRDLIKEKYPHLLQTFEKYLLII
jgi:hypothetical protein